MDYSSSRTRSMAVMSSTTPPPLLLLHLLRLLMLAAGVALVTGAGPTVHQSVVCLVEGPTSLQDELYLRCKDSGVINIRRVVHGFREQAEDTKTCGPPPQAPPTPAGPAPCTAADPAFLRTVLRRCMGGRECYVPVSKVYLDECGHNSNYVHVEYECVPDNSVEPDNIVDICGEMLQGTQVSRLSGYIKTPDYPELYPPDISCSCNLTALDSHAQITLTLLDIQLEEPRAAECRWDWLEYTTPHHGWGRGVKMCQQPPDSTTNTSTFIGNKTVLLNFRADNKVEDRGFWLKYEGRNMGGDEVEVLLQCKNFQPNIVRRSAACLSPPSDQTELYLDCSQVGVINVLTAQFGQQPLGGDVDQCGYQVAPPCSLDASSSGDLLRRCMGAASCNVPVTPQPLPPCAGGASSDYLQVKYQCVPEAYEPTNIVDVCGDVLNGRPAFRHSGYIESPRYPRAYPPGLKCQCMLSTDRGSSIRLRLLDVSFATDTVNAACDADWLAVSGSHAAPWGEGRRLCHAARGDTVDTQSSEIRVDFSSDDSVEDRGFWLHYSAVRPDGLHVGVQIMCEPRQEDGQLTQDTGEGATPLKRPTTNIGLVVGLTLITVLIVIILIVLVILKYRKVRQGKLTDNTSEAPTLPDTKESGTTFKKYSNLGDPGAQSNYQTLHDSSDSRPSSTHSSDTLRDAREPQPDYDVTVTSPGSYVNPAFDGTLGAGPYNNAPC